MSSGLRIPPQVRPALAALGGLGASEASKLTEALTVLPPFSPIHDLIAAVERAEIDLGDVEPDDVVYALMSLSSQKRRRNENVERMAVATAGSEDLKLATAQQKQAVSLFADLLEVPALATTAKAVELLTDHEHVFGGVRFLTDMRPVFADDAPDRVNAPDIRDEPVGAVVVTTMRIDYSVNGDFRSFYVALDLTDVRDLQAGVLRALEKIERIERFAKASSLPVVDAMVSDAEDA
jgi:hypothetical protein